MTTNTPTTGTLLTLDDVKAHTRLGRTFIYERMKTGEFPKPVRLPGGRAVRWRRRDIEEWAEKLPDAVTA